MKNSLTQLDARSIAKKLDATVITNTKAHDRAIIHYNGRRVADFGIRRGSRELPHNFLPKELELTRKQTLELSRCQLTKDAYFGIWLAKNPA